MQRPGSASRKKVNMTRTNSCVWCGGRLRLSEYAACGPGCLWCAANFKDGINGEVARSNFREILLIAGHEQENRAVLAKLEAEEDIGEMERLFGTRRVKPDMTLERPSSATGSASRQER